MAVLGTGKANGAISILHAAGTGYGCSLPVDLPVMVKLLDAPSKRELNDPDDLLTNVLDAWDSKGLPLPKERDSLHWAVASRVPPRQGLKSSSAISIAAIKALIQATEQELDDYTIIEIASQAQINSGVSITGSIDDSWACLTDGWKLIDANSQSIQEGIIMEGPSLDPEEWTVLILKRQERTQRPTLEDFIPFYDEFEKSLISIQQGDLLNCLTVNGRVICGVVGDIAGRKHVNDSFLYGARAAGMTGSGPAIVIFIPSLVRSATERMIKIFSNKPDIEEVVEVKLLRSETTDSEN